MFYLKSYASYFLWNETEIGLGLTGFGIFFSFLGIVFFFDKGFLAMGNVSVMPCMYVFSISSVLLVLWYHFNAGSFSAVLDQILFISGVSLTIGPKSTMQFFMKRQNFKVVNLSVSVCIREPCISCCISCSLYTTFSLLVMQGTISFGAGFFFVVIGWPVIGMILEAYGFIVLFRSVEYLSNWFIVNLLASSRWRCWWEFCTVVSGQHWQFSFRRYQFLDGCSNSLLWDRYVYLRTEIKKLFLDFHPCR